MKRVLSDIKVTMKELDENMVDVDNSISDCTNAVEGSSLSINDISKNAVSNIVSVYGWNNDDFIDN